MLTTPLLDRPASGWKYDLPKPDQPPSLEPYPSALPNPPNHVDNIYLELSRSTCMARGIIAWIAIFLISSFFLSLIGIVYFLAMTGYTPTLFEGISLMFAFVANLWCGVYAWRIDAESPRDEPIRFNRARRKVYVYRFHYDGLRPFSRSAWGIRAEVYDWDNLHAEACRVYGPMGTGGVIEAVTLAVLEPGTNKVLDRFHFAHGIQQGEMYWAMAQLFMQQGPHALPTFEYLPRDWNNEDVSYNLARRLAPKVKWPHAMDLESRTAP